VGSELALGALRAEHRKLVVNIQVGPPLVWRVLGVAWLPAALGADELTRSDHITRLAAFAPAA
jgi:hypothetical protein